MTSGPSVVVGALDSKNPDLYYYLFIRFSNDDDESIFSDSEDPKKDFQTLQDSYVVLPQIQYNGKNLPRTQETIGKFELGYQVSGFHLCYSTVTC